MNSIKEMTWKHYYDWLGNGSSEFLPNSRAPFPTQINTDSRTIGKDQFFIPIKGEVFDGHNFIADAVNKGAACFLYDHAFTPNLAAHLRKKGIAVENTQTAIQKIAVGWRRLCNPAHVMALTGSMGKTTVKELLAIGCLEQYPNTVYPKGSFNNELGVPLTMLKLTGKEDHLILEMGARHQGNITFLCELVLPTVSAVLNVRGVHLSEFGSMDAIYETKTEIFRDSPKDAVLVAPTDDVRILDLAKATGKKIVSFGTADNPTIKLSSQTFNIENLSTELTIETPSGVMNVKVPVVHEAIGYNIAAATAIAFAAGLDLRIFLDGVAKFNSAPGRFAVHRRRLDGLIIADDSYNANPDSMCAGFTTCAKIFPGKKTIAVLGSMKELGPDSATLHATVGRTCALTLQPDLIITVGEEARGIAEGAVAAGAKKEKILTLENVDQVIRLPAQVFTKREVIYIKGSNALKLERLVDHLLRT